MLPIKDRDFTAEFKFRTSRSSGSGGQSVNKVSSRVELIFHVGESDLLSQQEKELLIERLGKRIRNDGALHLISQEERTQLGNKKKVIARFMELLERALKPRKKRKASVVSENEKEKRIQAKKKNAVIKGLRRKPEDGD